VDFALRQEAKKKQFLSLPNSKKFFFNKQKGRTKVLLFFCDAEPTADGKPQKPAQNKIASFRQSPPQLVVGV